MHQVIYKKPAAKTLTKIPKPLARRFIAAFEQLADGLDDDGLDIKPLSGREGYRLRIGDWRALYRIEADRFIIEVMRIRPRGDVYK